MSYIRCTSRIDIGHADLDMPRIREIVGWLNDPITMQYSEQRHTKHTATSQVNYIVTFKHPSYYLSINHKGIMIGTSSVWVDVCNNIANIGILIGDRSSWKKGFGLEAWRAICDMMFEQGIRKIEAGCVADNTSMMSICSRYDMIEEGRQDDHFLYHGLPADLVHWGKFKS